MRILLTVFDLLLPLPYLTLTTKKDGWCCHGTAMLAVATQFKWRPAAERVVVYIMDGMNTRLGEGCVEENNRVANLKLMKDTVDRVVPIAVVHKTKKEKVADEFLMSMSKGMPAWQPFFSVEKFAELNTDEIIQQAQSITCGEHVAPVSTAPTRAPTGAPSKLPTKLPTYSPTSPGGCTASEWLLCDQSGNGL